MDKQGRINIRVSGELQNRLEEIKRVTKVSYSDICRPILEAELLYDQPTHSPSPDSDNALVSLASAFYPIGGQGVQEFCDKFEIDQRRMLFNMVFQLSEMMANQGPNLPETMTIEIPVVSKKHIPGHYSAVGVQRPRNSSEDGSTTEFEVETKRQSQRVKKITGKEQPSKNTKNKAQN